VKSKERIIGIGLLVVILAIALIIVLRYQSELNNLEQKKTSLSNDNTQLQQQNSDYATQIVELKSQIKKFEAGNYDETTMLGLQRKGFTGQLKDIVADLKMHPELIPYKGILGGTVGFYSDNDIHILVNRWVVAYFEDGHISGHMLLRYEINSGSISWEVIDSYLDV